MPDAAQSVDRGAVVALLAQRRGQVHVTQNGPHRSVGNCDAGQLLPQAARGTTFGFSHGGDERTWMVVIGPAGSSNPEVTREVLNTALASLNRPTLDS